MSKQIGVPINATFADQDYRALAYEIVSQPRFTGKLVLICWHHGNIPSLMLALRAKPDEFPDPWDPTIFNLILRLDYNDPAHPNLVKIIEPF